MHDPSSPQRNVLLASLPAADLRLLEPHLSHVPLRTGQRLFEPDEVIDGVIFPLSGMVSIMTVMNDGTEVETAAIGCEGAVGLVQGLGSRHVFWRALVQMEGQGLRIDAARFQQLARDSEAIRVMAGRYTEALLMQVLQLVACNALHPVEARFCRWLLMCRDRAASDVLPLTQEFLAEMLGVNRTTITQVAKGLQKAGVIEYRRGTIRLIDRPGLENTACECHALISHRFRTLLPARSVPEKVAKEVSSRR
ncbi:MAG TPA: Crp/Fnr family transcriptional regulator [Beijerinckiaceae bacterium]|jgi:CRP-like cAMP-binding protein